MRTSGLNILFFFLVAFLASTIMTFNAHSANHTFSATVASGAEVTMGDPTAVVPVTITNNSSSRSIREIRFKVNDNFYEFGSSTVPPTGWCIKDIDEEEITFALVTPGGGCSSGSTPSAIAPGESLVFSINVLPMQASADVANDTFRDIDIESPGGFSMEGPDPAWARRALEASMTAAPASTGVGGEITLTMQVINRSTSTQSAISSTPAPPTPSNPIVTLTGGPYYGSTLLAADLTAAASTIAVTSTTEFASSGTVVVDSEEICYSGKTSTTLTGAVRGCNSTVASAHNAAALVYNYTPFSLSSNSTGTVIWTYNADAAGSVYFTARATSGSGSATSVSVTSNTVIIGDFTAALTLTPTSVITGQNVNVTMTLQNNTSTTLVNVTPGSLAPCSGGATETLLSGASPASITNIAPSGTGAFTWTYRITGSIGQPYCLSGAASADGPVATNNATSNTGTVSEYSVTVSPSVVASGSTNKTLTWSVFNGSGCPVNEVRIEIPERRRNWNCSSVNAPSGWRASCDDERIRFRSRRSRSDLGPGETLPFSITFSTTETVTADKVVEFPVRLRTRGCGETETYVGTYVTVTLNALGLAADPAGPVYADGAAAYTITATLTSAGTPLAGKTITFTADNGTLASGSAVTDINGTATVVLTAPVSATDTAATVTASFLTANGTITLDFTGWNKANLQYWGALTPVTLDCGVAYTFTMKVKNVHPSASMNLTTGSYFALNDSAAGGSAVMLAYLDTPAMLTPGSIQTLSFGSATSAGGGGGVTLPSAFIAGDYTPKLNQSPPPESGLFFTDGGTNDQYRTVADRVTVTGGCGDVSVDVLDWHEMH